MGGLPDEPDRSEARDAGELLRHPIRRFPIVSEDDHLGVRLLHELVPHDPSRLRELRMFHVGLPRELDRLLHPRVLQELHVCLRLRLGLHLVEVRAEGTEALGLREFHRVVRLHRDCLRGHRAVEPAIADSGVESLPSLVAGREQVLQAHLRLAREEADLLESLDLLLEDDLEERPDLLRHVGGFHRDPLDLEAMEVRDHVRVVFRPDLDRGDPEIPADLEDLLRGGPGGRGHPEHKPSRDLLVCRGHVDVCVVADRSVGFVEHDQAHIVQGDPLRPDVVPDHLRRRHDDLVLPPEEFALFRGRRLAGEEGDPIDDEDLPQGGRMLLDEGFRRGEEEDLAPFSTEDLGDHHRRDDRLPHAGRKDDERGPLQGGTGDVHLVRPFLDGSAAQ